VCGLTWRSIDKTSSAELSEAINSMYRWYVDADICYAYLSDVPTAGSVLDPSWGGLFDIKKVFERSRWFSRGWTLQELLAPSMVEFFAQDWTSIGLKSNLTEDLAHITRINIGALEGADLASFHVAERMSWAANRQTTRIEDKAYSLLGIFEVHMPLLYGEGKRAFVRLQEEILKNSEDYTIFSWSASPIGRTRLAPSGEGTHLGLLADDPIRFRGDFSPWRYSDVVPVPHQIFRLSVPSLFSSLQDLNSDNSPPVLTGRGLRICLPLLEVDVGTDWYLACLRCQLETTKEYLCIALKKTEKLHVFEKDLSNSRSFPLPSANMLPRFRLCTVYVEQRSQEESLPKLKPGAIMINHASMLYSGGLELLSCQKYVEAEGLFDRTLSLRKRLLPRDDPDIMRTLLALAETYERQSKHEEHVQILAEIGEVEKRAEKTSEEDVTTVYAEEIESLLENLTTA
jgi:hypothetical protein